MLRIFWLVIWLVVADATGVRAANDADWKVCAGQDGDQAIAACTRIADDKAEITEHRAIAFYNRGVSYGAKGEHDRAIADYDQAIKLKPDYPDAFVHRGISYGAKGEHGRAIADYDQAIKLKPDYAIAFVHRGISYGAKGEYDRAIANYDQAIKLNPDYPDAFVHRGISYYAKGDYDRAIADFDRAIKLKPNLADAFQNRGISYNAKGEYDRAIADYDQAIKLDPQNITAFYGRGASFVAKGERARAIVDYARAEAIPIAGLAAYHRLNQENARKELAKLLGPGETALAVKPVETTPVLVPVKSRRVALVLGNSGYTSVAALPNPRRDAALVADALRSNGFQSVSVANDLTRENLFDALRTFAAVAEKAEWALVYYAGHGIEVGGVNYLIPVDAKLATDRDVQFEAVPLDYILGAVEGAKRLRVVLLDACRDNPFAARMRRINASRSIGRGFASIEPEAGTLVVYAAKHGQTAADGDGANSPFASAVVKRLMTPGLEIRKLFDLVRDDVMETTSRRQQPYTYGSVPGNEDFYFVAKR